MSQRSEYQDLLNQLYGQFHFSQMNAAQQQSSHVLDALRCYGAQQSTPNYRGAQEALRPKKKFDIREEDIIDAEFEVIPDNQKLLGE